MLLFSKEESSPTESCKTPPDSNPQHTTPDNSSGFGNDTILSRRGRDILRGSDGNDYLNGGLDVDILTGGNEIDTVIAVDGYKSSTPTLDPIQQDVVRWSSYRDHDTVWIDAATTAAHGTFNCDVVGTQNGKYTVGPGDPTASNVVQGDLGNCALAAGLAPPFFVNYSDSPWGPAALLVRRRVVDFADGTYGVQLGDSVYRVDADLPSGGNRPAFARGRFFDGTLCLWPSIIEKSFATRMGMNYANIKAISSIDIPNDGYIVVTYSELVNRRCQVMVGRTDNLMLL